MMERIYALAEADIDTFVGTNRANLITLSNLFPKTKLRLHQNVLKILGEDQAVEELMHVLSALEQLCSEYNQLTEAQIIETVRRLRSGQEGGGQPSASDVIIYGIHGKAIQARGRAQQRLVSDFGSCDLCFATGAAGSGKTFIAICLAVKALKAKQVRRIILSRPAVEAGEKLGFLPGEMKDKLDPYLQPLYDALGELIPAPKLKDLMDTGVIQIAPLAFMRGRTLSDAVVILDEAQNTTPQQMKMFLTRLGMNSKMVITGDFTQVDLPRGVPSGLRDALDKLEGIRGIGFVHFGKQDIVRHPLVSAIVERYDEREREAEQF
ncbi:PhoH family protein [Porphyromonas sp. oral taxon 275]|uniref:PhoH family protein n=1 Tax=Porphyromonas sp. oral taxon 275 TaxID=712435 RepID=UPI001BA81EF1|nr:PhoH family protein [Porphyromonas sp. oral taxon 275]QUB42335.1 PhoH family protein [Porphyromonas sp. oral taxon 275]